MPEGLTYDSDPEAYKEALHHRLSAQGPRDWGQWEAIACVADVLLGVRPETWRDVARGWSLSWPPSQRESAMEYELEQLERSGLSPDDRLPEWEDLRALAILCRNWRDGTGPFVDGAEFDLPPSVQASEAHRPALRARVVEHAAPRVRA